MSNGLNLTLTLAVNAKLLVLLKLKILDACFICHLRFSIGTDPVMVRWSGPHKNLVVGFLWLRPHENFTEINLISEKNI